jgi:UDP-2,3-diacylglucosamine pyrophosphatase LpxH
MMPLDGFPPATMWSRKPVRQREPVRFRAIWISDLHLGTSECRVGRLLELLKLTDSETLCLLGDIIDSWELKRRWYWNQSHNEVVQAIFEKANAGTRVVFIPGNHDDPLRKFIGLDLAGIRIRDELVHVTAKGKRMLVLHGDRFDGVLSKARWLHRCGGTAGSIALRLLQTMNNWHGRIGLPYRSRPRSRHRAVRPTGADAYLRSFENALADEARRKGLDGVICGHIHQPEIRNIGGVLYCNDGDWVEHQSVLVEDLSGELRLADWHEIIVQSDRDGLCQEMAQEKL